MANNMRKGFSILVLMGLVGLGILGPIFAVQAVTEGVLEGCYLTEGEARLTNCSQSDTEFCGFASSTCGVCCLLQTLYKVTDWIFVILVAVAGLFVIIGAMNLLTSAGDTAKVSSGRSYIMYAAIGLIVAFLARAIPAIVKLAVGA